MSVAVETEQLLESEPRALVSLLVPVGLRLKISLEDFWTLCLYNSDLRLERNAQGELIAMSPAGSKSGGLEVEIIAPLYNWAKRDGRGQVFGPSAGFTLPNGAVRAPDASWIKLDRWNQLTEEQQERFAPIVPDFVVELCSPSDSRIETGAKMAEYIDQGASLGWLIDPKSKEAEIYRRGRSVETLLMPVSLSGEDVLPGFILELAPIFKDRTAAQAGGTDG